MQFLHIYYSVRKVSTSFCVNLVDFNEAGLHETTFIRKREFFPVSQWRQLMASRILVRYCLVLSSDCHCKENDGTNWLQGRTHTPRTRHQWLWCSWSQGLCLWSPACPGWTGTPRKKSVHFPYNEKNTKHFLTQMLLAINWFYWQAGKIHACVWRFKIALVQARFIEIHQVFAK